MVREEERKKERRGRRRKIRKIKNGRRKRDWAHIS
jgi:hypothetical protein